MNAVAEATAAGPGPVPGERRSRVAALLASARQYDPLLRNGHLLTVSSLLTAAIGALYWVFAAHLFGPSTVGRTYSAISALMFLAGVGQLNLANTMVRFVATAGHRTRRLVLLAYLVAACTGLLLGAGFVLLIPRLAPDLALLPEPWLGVGYALGTAGYAIFALQDGVLTGLRHADWVVLENALFSAVKIVCLALFAAAGATAGILGSWAVGLAVALVLANTYIFGHALPAHLRRAPRRRTAASVPSPGYLAGDWVGSVCWQAVVSLPPIMVLNSLGAADSAYFSIAWLVAYALYQFAINMCSSLIVESADDPVRLRRHCLQVLRHAGRLLTLAVLLTVVAAPWLLALFGSDYARGGTGALRLLALSALPNLLVTVVIAVARVQRRIRVVMGVLLALAALVLGLTAVLLPLLGIVGGGLAWLVAQCTLAGALLWRRDWWLPAEQQPGAAHTAVPAPAVPQPRAGVAGLGWLRAVQPIRRPSLLYAPVDRLATRRIARQLRTADGPELHRTAPGLSDVLVLRLDQDLRPPLAVKHPRNAAAAHVLAHEWDVLSELSGDRRLGEWRRLLPAAVSCRLDDQVPLLTEGWLPGEPADELLRRCPPAVERAAAAEVAALALDAIDELHRATGRPECADPHLDAWVDRPLDLLAADIGWCRTGAGAEGLAALGDLLHAGLSGRTMDTAWTHGDFHPGNILLDPDRTRVTGVIDWGGARADGPAQVDACTFLLTLHCLHSGEELGSTVRDVLRAGALPPEDLRLAGGARVSGESWTGVELALLTWLWHTRSNLEKSPRYARNRWWIARNVAPVLVEAAKRPGARR
jgi:O-antigen/teichoic acid export membrane protein/aminoglycoside phosphotransferase (APT) family kinase protein